MLSASSRTFLAWDQQRVAWRWIIGLLLIYAVGNGYAAQQLSVTGDELNYYEYGVRIWKGDATKPVLNGVPVFNSHMPISAVYVIPRVIKQLIQPNLKQSFVETQRDIQHARWISILIGVWIGWMIARWCVHWFGFRAAVFATAWYVLCPNMLAHTAMVSTDVFFYAFTLAMVYAAWCYQQTNQRRYLLGASVALGLALVSKPTAILLIPLLSFFFLWRLWKPAYSRGKWILPWIKQQGIAALISLFVVNAAFLFTGTGVALHEYAFLSGTWKAWAQLPFVQHLPLPVPQPWIYTFDYVQFNMDTPPGIAGLSAYGQTTFLNKPISGDWIPAYYSIVLALKWPFTFWLALLTLAGVAWNRRVLIAWRNVVYLIVPVVFFLLSFVFLNRMYLGIRNVLMIMPFLFVALGGLMSWGYSSRVPMRLFFGVLLLVQLVEVARWFPHFLPYTNGIVHAKKLTYQWFSDSNLYAQEGWRFAQSYLRVHPDVQYEPEVPVKGRVMVSVETYVDFWRSGKCQWLRELRLVPIDHVDGQYLIFAVP